MSVSSSTDLITIPPIDIRTMPPVTATGTFSPSGLSIAGRITVVSIDNLTWTPLPPVALVNRNALAIQNTSGQEIIINYVNTNPGYVGVKIVNNGERGYDIKDTIIIYAKSSLSACTIQVEELS